MKLLIVTQAVDSEDPILGFFVRWIEELAKQVERVEVVCLREGKHTLPANVRVYSLGKERRSASSLVYAIRFKKLVWQLRRDYDAVFVHMNQEYILIGGWLWKLLGKRIYLWRNHYAGSWLTDVAAAFCVKVFCTSKRSYTAKYKKTVIMPVGVDTERFFPDAKTARKPRSILFFSRMSPSKRPEMLLEALKLLAERGVEFSADFYGSPLPKDQSYYDELVKKADTPDLKRRVSFYPSIPNDQAPGLYRTHEIFVNASPSGMLDKTIFEAAASGCIVLAASADFAESAGETSHFNSVRELADRIESILTHPSGQPSSDLIEHNSLHALVSRLTEELALGKS